LKKKQYLISFFASDSNHWQPNGWQQLPHAWQAPIIRGQNWHTLCALRRA